MIVVCKIIVLFILPSFNLIGLSGGGVGGVMNCELVRPVPTELPCSKRNNTSIVMKIDLNNINICVHNTAYRLIAYKRHRIFQFVSCMTLKCMGE